MGSRERKRAERRKRKARGATAGRASEPTAGESTNGEPGGSAPSITAGYAGAKERDRAARESLEPLHEGERPLVVTIGAVISAVIAVSILIGYAAGVEVNGDRPELVQVISPALITGIMAWGMWRARYWAVLGFQTILLFLIAAAAFGLALQAASAAQILANVLLLAVAGTFFYFMIKAMARIQMPHRLPRE